MKYVISQKDLETRGSNLYVFEGYKHGATTVSLHLTDLLPGQGPRMHRHTNEGIFVFHEGNVTFTLGNITLEVTTRQIVIAPADMPHKFINSGEGPLCKTSIHPRHI